jgi:hypothetical protein
VVVGGLPELTRASSVDECAVRTAGAASEITATMMYSALLTMTTSRDPLIQPSPAAG